MQTYFSHDQLRKGQKEFVFDVGQTIENKKNLLAHAPTGIGKTAAVLGPAITYALQNNKTIFFLTPKISQHKIAVQELQKLQQKYGLDFLAADLVGKKSICPDTSLQGVDHTTFYEVCKQRKKAETCKFYSNFPGFSDEEKQDAKNYFNDFLGEYGSVQNQEFTQEYSLSHKNKPLCSYELSLELAKQSNVVICDYLHVLYPFIAKQFLKKIGKEISDSIIILDEVHNVPDRLRSTLSQNLSEFILKKAITELKEMNWSFEKLEELLLSLKKLGESTRKEKIVLKEELAFFSSDEVSELLKLGEAYLNNNQKSRSAILSVAKFLYSWNQEEIGYTRILKKDPLRVMHKCLDVSIVTSELFKEAHSVIGMSGTLLPLEMYKDVLGFDSNTILKEYGSPFKQQNRLNIIDKEVTTRYAKRSEREYQRIQNKVSEIVECIPGNVAVFFPSYRVMREVTWDFKSSKPVLVQQEKSSPEEISKLLNEFKSRSAFGAVLFAVAGGSFSEGVDLPGRDLLCSVVVGVPFSEWNLETQALINYYDHKFGRGRDYGYLFPAMRKAVQAAGRVIRTEEDKGVCVFLDERFAQSEYAKCLPKELSLKFTTNPSKEINSFF